VLAPEHPLTTALASAAQREEVLAYVAAAAAKSDIDRSDATREKTGVALGVSAKNPLNGERVPVWVGDYVIGSYGTGAVMAVPAHDERDHAFAVKYTLPIVGVIAPADGRAVDVLAAAFTDDGVTNEAARARSLCPLPAGTSSEEARRAVTAWLAAEGQGEARVTYRLRDWVFSRQRYWGEPIPIYCPVRCDGDPRLPGASYEIDYATPLPVPEAELPLVLPDLEDFKPGTDPAGPLARAADWRFFQKDGAWFARETNTMPQWAGSCWYYLRFLDPTNTEAAWSQEAYDAWMPVDLYMGGAEHAVLHLLYARVWHKVLFDLGLVSHGEPFTRLVHQGLILGEDSQKMSKSRGNVVNPDDVVKSHGADSLRLYEMFMGPLEAVKPWQTSGIEGVRRFLDRVWNVATGPLTDDPAAYDLATRRAVHKTVKKVGDDIEALRFNTAISAMMILVKALGALPAVPREAAKALVLLVSPFAPHLGEELWSRLGATESLAYEPWPSFDPALVRDAEVEIGVQVNGKVRSVITLEVDATEETARAVALEDEKVRAFIGDKTLKKFIYVKGKIVNVVVA
jgi:leucyl-tRNA synthetase